MIHGQVVAADALATPLFWVLLWLVVRLRSDAAWPAFIASLLVVMLLEMAAILVKFTFGSFVAAAAVWAILQWWTKRLSARRLVVAVILLACIPALFARAEMRRYQSQQSNSIGIRFVPVSQLSEAAMTPRSILFFRPADLAILAAPAYDWTVDDRYELLINNKHSFPALLHLAMFTDILNIYQFDPVRLLFWPAYRRESPAHASGRPYGHRGDAHHGGGRPRDGRAFHVHRCHPQRSAKPRCPERSSVLSAWFVNIVGALPFVNSPTTGATGFHGCSCRRSWASRPSRSCSSTAGGSRDDGRSPCSWPWSLSRAYTRRSCGPVRRLAPCTSRMRTPRRRAAASIVRLLNWQDWPSGLASRRAAGSRGGSGSSSTGRSALRMVKR